MEPKTQTLIKLSFSTIDRYRESRTFKTLAGARKYAHRKIGPHPEIGGWYAVGTYGDSKIEIREGCTFAEPFPAPEAAAPSASNDDPSSF